MEVTKKKNRSSEKDNLPTDKKNNSIHILGDIMVKHVEGWKLKKSIDKDHNVYVRSFSKAKGIFMEDYVKHFIREKIRLTLFSMLERMSSTNELPPEKIVKSIIAMTNLTSKRWK